MVSIRNDKGSVLVFATLMIVLLMIMVGMGLDTGELVYTRSMGQAAVDAAALSAVTALPAAIAKNDDSEVKSRAAAYATTTKNNYTGSSTNQIGNANVTYVQYDFVNNKVTNYNVALAAANGVRVALEDNSAMKTPAFLTPVMRLFGTSNAAQSTNNVSVSAVSVISGRPSIPIALWQQSCQGGSTVKDMEIAQQNPANG